jgi:hypothetical protein
MGDSKITPDLADTEVVRSSGGDDGGDEWRVGLRLADRYVLRRFLGKGGMGQVWVAFDEVLDKDVALKRVRRDVVAAGDALESLRREVSLAQTVTHVNVCRIYDLEPLDGDWCIKMEVIGGRSLAATLEESPSLPVERAQRIARQLADGLAAVHAVGIVHRDLKPHNVLIDDSGRTVLMDFGIARTSAPSGDTAPGRITGTPEYMAPEQARGQRVDARADLYALGCVLYRMLAGEVPFPAATRLAAMARHLTDPPPDARTRRREVPAWLARLARELMAKSPDRRPRDAATVRDRLVGPPSPAPRIAAAVVASLLLAGIAVAGWSGWRAHVRDRWRPELADLPAEYDARGRRTRPSPDGTHIAFNSYRSDEVRVMAGPAAGGELIIGPAGHHLLAWTHDGRALLVGDKSDHLSRFDLADRRLEPLGIEALGAADCGDALFTVEPATARCTECATLVVHERERPPRELYAAGVGTYLADLIACDARSRRVAYTLYDNAGTQDHLFIRSLDAAAAVEVGDRGGHQFIKLGSFTDRGTMIVNALDGKTTHVWELPMQGGHARQLGFGGDEFLPTVAGDGRLFFETIRTTSALYARPDGGSAQRLTFGDERITGATPTPDGRAIVLTIKRAYAGDEQLVLHPLDDRPEQVLAHAGEGGNLELAERFVGDTLYYQLIPIGGQGGPLMAWSMRDGRTRKVRDLPDGALLGVSDGYVHVGADRGALRVPLDGGAATLEAPKPWNVVVEAPSGGWRLTARWDIVPPFALFAPGAPLDGKPALTMEQYPRFTADGRAALFSRAGKIISRDLASGRESVVAELADVGLVVQSPDGKTLFYTQVEQYVRRQVMTNFAERPPL